MYTQSTVRNVRMWPMFLPVSVVVPTRLCSSPESMDEKSSESETSLHSICLENNTIYQIGRQLHVKY